MIEKRKSKVLRKKTSLQWHFWSCNEPYFLKQYNTKTTVSLTTTTKNGIKI